MIPTDSSHASLRRFVPLVAAFLLIGVFVKLGLWQLDRAGEKVAMRQAFENPTSYVAATSRLAPEPYQALKASGRWLPGQQVLIDNVVQDGRLGYFVISAFEVYNQSSLLLVNRGWTARQADAELPNIALPGGQQSLRGKAGRLPRVGIRPGDAFEGQQDWPKTAVWPTIDEIGSQLQRPLMDYVLLLDADEPGGFVRDWQPKQAGPSKHYGYAFQWFAMATGVLAIAGWYLVSGRRRRDD